MKLPTIPVALSVVLMLCVAPANVHGLADCTTDEIATVKSVLFEKLIQTTCTDMKFDSSGTADLTDTTYCDDSKCVKAIKKVRKALPKCKYNGANARAPYTKMVEACSADDDEEEDEDTTTETTTTTTTTTAPASTTKTPTPTTVKPATTTATPSEGTETSATGSHSSGGSASAKTSATESNSTATVDDEDGESTTSKEEGSGIDDGEGSSISDEEGSPIEDSESSTASSSSSTSPQASSSTASTASTTAPSTAMSASPAATAMGLKTLATASLCLLAEQLGGLHHLASTEWRPSAAPNKKPDNHIDTKMKLRAVGLIAVLCMVACGSRADAAETETPKDCTDAQLAEAQQIIAKHEIETTCTTLKLDAAGVPDLTNLSFCSDEKCIKTIKRVRKSMPSCLYNGKRLRAGMSKLVNACDATSTAKSEGGDAGSGSANATTTPKTKKPKKTKTPAPTEGSSTGSSMDSEEGNLIENEDETIEPRTEAPTTAPPTEAPATVPTVTKTNSSSSAIASRTAFLTVLSTVLALTFLC